MKMHVTLAIDVSNLKCYMWWLFVTKDNQL